jgi:uncharacterized membrane protein (DUF2068 family)
MGNVPTGVKIISVLGYIGAVFLALFGLLFLVASGSMGALAAQIPVLATLGAGLFVVAGLVMIAFGVLSFFVARGLWKGSNWARIVTIIFSALGVLFAVIGMFKTGVTSNLFSFIVNGVIGYYLLFSRNVKKAFR